MENVNLADVWNNTIEKRQSNLSPRDRVYASELGGSMIDRYLKMNGEPYTNPPNSRSMRKFMAGDIWEWIVQNVLVRAGIQFKTQEKILVEYEGLLPISGRVDFIITGDTDFSKVEIDPNMPPFMQELVPAIVEHFKHKKYEQGIIEVKSVGSFVFESLLANDNPKTHHMLQAFIYRKALSLPASVFYVCRDDVRLLQYNIESIAQELEEMVIEDLKQITYYYHNKIEPPKEALILWDEVTEKFTKNWKVEYSPYLSKLYKTKLKPDDTEETYFKQPDEYYDWATPIVSGMNRVVARIKEGKPMTKSNEEWIEKMKEYGYSLDSLKITKAV